MLPFKHGLGEFAESKLYGFKGIISARSENLYGCNRYYIQQKFNEKLGGKLPESYWVDEDDVVVQKGKGLVPKKKDTGGPASTLL